MQVKFNFPFKFGPKVGLHVIQGCVLYLKFYGKLCLFISVTVRIVHYFLPYN